MESGNNSIAYLPKLKKYPLYEAITLENRENYYRISVIPISKIAEDDMELLSDMVTGESYLHHWESGVYLCAKCKNILYSSKDKWKGPCVWPSFRKPYDEMTSMKTFYDSREKGDGLSAECTGWRH